MTTASTEKDLLSALTGGSGLSDDYEEDDTFTENNDGFEEENLEDEEEEI
jgi:hypothetical protein